MVGWTTRDFASLAGEAAPGELAPRLLGVEQSNSSVRFGERLILKLFRKLEPGVNPDLEIVRYLADRTTFRHMPLAGGLDPWRCRRVALPGSAPTAGAGATRRRRSALQGFIPNEGDAWHYTLDALGRYFERVRTGWGRGDFGPAQRRRRRCWISWRRAATACCRRSCTSASAPT